MIEENTERIIQTVISRELIEWVQISVLVAHPNPGVCIKKKLPNFLRSFYGAPGGTRTPNLLIRSLGGSSISILFCGVQSIDYHLWW